MNQTAWIGIGFNAGILLGGIAGIFTPGIAALLHNSSTIALCLNNMQDILTEPDKADIIESVE
jgi:cation transport ATPase